MLRGGIFPAAMSVLGGYCSPFPGPCAGMPWLPPLCSCPGSLAQRNIMGLRSGHLPLQHPLLWFFSVLNSSITPFGIRSAEGEAANLWTGPLMPRGKVLLGLGGMRPSSVVLAGGWTHIWVRKPWQRLPAWQKQSRGTETRAWYLGDSKVSPSGRKDQSRATELSCTAPASDCLEYAGGTVLGRDHPVQGENGPRKGYPGTSRSWSRGMPGHTY